MKRNILRWSIDACFLVAMAWGFGWLFYIITGVFFLLLNPPAFLDQILRTSHILAFGVLFVSPLLIGLIMSTIFAFISIKFHPSIDRYIVICALLVILPTLPYMKSLISRLERSDDLNCLYFSYVALGIFVGNFIYQRIKSISNATSTPS